MAFRQRRLCRRQATVTAIAAAVGYSKREASPCGLTKQTANAGSKRSKLTDQRTVSSRNSR